MNVLFLTSTLPRYAGDQQAPFVLEQAAAWKAKRPGDHLIILAPHDAAASMSEEIAGVQIERYRYMWPPRAQTLAYPAMLPNIRKKPTCALQLPLFLGAQYRAAKHLVQKHSIDLVYAHWVMPQGVVAHQLKRATGTPYLLQNHSSDLAVFSKLGRPGKALARKVLRGANAFFCVNSSQREAALALVPELTCNVLPMGVSLDVSEIEPTGSQEQYPYALGMMSRLSKKKGIDHLIAALEQLAAQDQSPRVAIAGGGEDEAELKALPKQADIDFPGFLTGSQKLEFFNQCYAMAFPSVSADGDVEGLPVALLEALAVGKPVIASADTNIKLLEEWPDIGEDIVFLEDPSDTDAFAACIKELLSLPAAEAAARSARSRDSVGRYLWDRLIDEYLGLIDRAVT